ncbi:MAG: hypothetical protein AAF081_05170 [Actinomycetota bacterium]
MRRRLLLLLLAVIAGSAACSIEDGGGEGRADVNETTTTIDAPTTTDTRPPGSIGIVEVAGEVHELDADCYAPGAGELVVTGTATTAGGARIEVFVQAFVGRPYVGITVVDEIASVRYEPAVDRPLDITLLDDVVRVDDVALVTDLDLTTGEGTDAGVGTVVVECRSYEAELPVGFDAG